MRRARRFNIDQVFLDVAFTLTALFAAMLAVVVQVAKLDTGKATAEAVAMRFGNVAIDARWPDGSPADVDLWVKAPQDLMAVGYSRRSDRQTSYLRDDTGASNDPGDLNYENAFVRGAVAGTYVVNLHLYNTKGAPLPLRVKVSAAILPSQAGAMQKIAEVEILLHESGEEVTAFSFDLDARGRLVPNSVGDGFTPLRGGRPTRNRQEIP